MSAEPTDIITIMGATASGKTNLAVNLAYQTDAEIISADSRQVYRGMDIGTGKDLAEYDINGTHIPHHLIDIVDAGYRYNVFEYQADFLKAYKSAKERGKNIVLCGGSGMYIEAVINGYNLLPVPVNDKLRTELEQKEHAELVEILSKLKRLHNKTDIDNKKRTIRAIEIEYFMQENNIETREYPAIKNVYFELHFDRETRRKRITHRLNERLKNGMVEEVENLMKQGLTLDDMLFYGLEYKYIGLYLCNNLTYDEMTEKLNIAIHQFAKRQMTWFRGMERKGAIIHILDGNKTTKELLDFIQQNHKF
ncbi:MAG: tRNA (adenosine(37)-N6)-dimethylallyltransferase MiaA [Prevotellaceae bacterium]|jgi:tRNA dimethylallyltransferase|nr:tRNA (adenosine(37)-N6)-dimethylallyltransferase MiaA [Prevotellaceae bacterium]